MINYYHAAKVNELHPYLRHGTAVWRVASHVFEKRLVMNSLPDKVSNKDTNGRSPSHSVFFIPLLFIRRCRFLTFGVSILPSIPLSRDDETVLFEMTIASSLLKQNRGHVR
jgi:hypothetical protein